MLKGFYLQSDQVKFWCNSLTEPPTLPSALNTVVRALRAPPAPAAPAQPPWDSPTLTMAQDPMSAPQGCQLSAPAPPYQGWSPSPRSPALPWSLPGQAHLQAHALAIPREVSDALDCVTLGYPHWTWTWPVHLAWPQTYLINMTLPRHPNSWVNPSATCRSALPPHWGDGTGASALGLEGAAGPCCSPAISFWVSFQ